MDMAGHGVRGGGGAATLLSSAENKDEAMMQTSVLDDQKGASV